MSKKRQHRRLVKRIMMEGISGFSLDKRRRRRQHRKAARRLIDGGTLLNAKAPVGSTPWTVARWHLKMARCWKR